MCRFFGVNNDITDWEWHDDPHTVTLLIHLLAMSAKKATEYHGRKLKIGQLVTSRSELSKMCGISERCVRTCLSRLEKSKIVTSETTSQGTVVTVEKSWLYVITKEKATSETTSERPTSDQQTTSEVDTMKTERPIKKSSRPSEDYTPEFENFWAQYPRHTAKKSAFKAWRAVNPKGINPTQDEQEAILHDIAVRLGRGEWQEEQYIPHASTYLNGRRWEDEAKPTHPAEAGKGYYNPFIQMALEAEERERNEGI
jgi:DNA-binding transcriptional regulator YhcF (GntR family)